jgi:outer membrane beta-barrel protein
MKTTSSRSLKARFASLGVASLLAAAATFTPSQAEAQEIQITGPLAGAPAVRKLRLYREGRFELAVGPGFTLLDEYKRTIFLSGRLQYNIFDWLGIGVWGGFSPDALSLNTDLTDKIESTAPRNSRTAINLPDQAAKNAGQKFEDQTAKFAWIANPQVTFSPFRGKLALFQKLFVDTDLYVHGGVAIVGLNERGDCGATGQVACTAAASFKTQSRTAVTGSFGVGLTFYPSDFISVNVEWRGMPLEVNRGGFDSRGAGSNGRFPDLKIDSEDRTFKLNQIVFLAAGFHFPTTPTISQ